MTKRSPPEDKQVQIGRLAMRHENDLWVAYYALTDTMKDAIFLGSIRMGIVSRDPARKDIFMKLMRDAVADIFEEKTGFRPRFHGPEDAPEHERSGHG